MYIVQFRRRITARSGKSAAEIYNLCSAFTNGILSTNSCISTNYYRRKLENIACFLLHFDNHYGQGRLVMKAAKAAAYPVFLADFLFYFYLKIFEICIKFHWLSLVLSAMTNPPPPKKKKIFFSFFFGDFFCEYFLFLMATLKKAAISYAFLEAGET